jgi:hypothetical protein
MKTPKLSPAQILLLKSMTMLSGTDFAPGGYPGAGPDASRWWRTMECLARNGLVERLHGVGAYRITDKGRDTVLSL